jgi:hypothetical protein
VGRIMHYGSPEPWIGAHQTQYGCDCDWWYGGGGVLSIDQFLEVSGKNTEDIKVVVIGAGAFGLVCWMPE